MRTGKNNPNWRGGKTIKHCIDCGVRVSRNNKGGRCRSCSKTGELNTFFLKNHSKKTKLKMSASHITRDKTTYKGKPIPFDVLSAAMKKRWENSNEEQRKKLIKPFIEAGLKACKKSSKTKIENIINDILIKNNIKFKRNHQISIFNVDFLIEGKLIIECMGDYWHCNPVFYKPDFYNKSIKLTSNEKWEKDLKRKKSFEEKGYKILCLWEYDIKNKTEFIETQILNFIKTNNYETN